MDRQGEPTIDHCRRVAAALREQGHPVEVQVAGVLHDTLETKAGSWTALRDLFGPNVANLVDALTHRASMNYSEYIETVIMVGPQAVAIKLADLRDNLDASRGPIPESLRKRYLRAVERLTRKDG